MVTKIPLTQGMFALVDDEDAEKANRYRWYPKKKKSTCYAVTSVKRTDGKRSMLRMHKFLTGYNQTDHANGNGLDNRRENLRDATHSENARNSRKMQGTTSQFKGVHWHAKRACFAAFLRVPNDDGGSGRRTWLGYFTDESNAAHAYDAAAREYFGEYAALNFPRPGERSALTGEIIPLESEAA